MLRDGQTRGREQAAGYVWEGGKPFYGTRVGPGWYQGGTRVARGCKLPFSVLRMLMQVSRKPSPTEGRRRNAECRKGGQSRPKPPASQQRGTSEAPARHQRATHMRPSSSPQAPHEPPQGYLGARCKPGACGRLARASLVFRSCLACVPFVFRSYSACIPLICRLYSWGREREKAEAPAGSEALPGAVIGRSPPTSRHSRRPEHRCKA